MRSRDEFTEVKKRTAFMITPKVMARITTILHAGFVTSPISCKAGKASNATAIENKGAPTPTIKPIKASYFLFLKIPLV